MVSREKETTDCYSAPLLPKALQFSNKFMAFPICPRPALPFLVAWESCIAAQRKRKK